MNIAEKIKRQTDKILRQQNQGPNAGRVIIETSTGGNLNTIPGTDLATHKTSSDHDGRYARAFTDLNDVPASYPEGSGGKIIAIKDDLTGLEFVSAPAATNGIPTGGADNQLLAKDGADDYVVKWVNAPSAANGIPAGGTAGQILSKVDGTNYNAQWIDAPSGGGSPFVWDAMTTTEGQNKSRTTGGTFSSLTAIIQVFKPIKITHIYWDIKKAATYTLKIFNTAQAAPVVVSADDQVEVEFALTNPLLLTPGRYKFKLESSINVVWDDNSSGGFSGTFCEAADGCIYNTTAYSQYYAPIKIKAYVGAWND